MEKTFLGWKSTIIAATRIASSTLILSFLNTTHSTLGGSDRNPPAKSPKKFRFHFSMNRIG